MLTRNVRNATIDRIYRSVTFSGLLIGCILLSLAGAHPATAQIYVDASATGAENGSSWADAYTDLQDALDTATGSDEIWIAEGTYMPSEPLDTDDPRTATFEIAGDQDGLKIYGGFERGDAFADRDPSTNETILSGDIGTEGDASDNSYRVVVFNGGNTSGSDVDANITSDTELNGVTITGGNADGTFPIETGGGLYCDGYGPDNECSPQLANIIFIDNTASWAGGALHAYGGSEGVSSPQITNSAFMGNSAVTGGAIYNLADFDGESSPEITNATFMGNSADKGGAIYNLAEFGGESSPQIINAVFTGNSADSFGGAIANSDIREISTPVITNTILWGNTASSSGDEIHNRDVTLTLSHTLIEGGVNGPGVGGNGNNTDGGGNLDADPLFVNANAPAGPDGVFATEDDGLRLVDSSPALDAGDNAPFESGGSAEDVDTDLLGEDRIQNGTVSLGPYESGTIPLILHVDANATGAANGASWTDAYTDLQDALDVAQDDNVIVIAEGTYTPSKQLDGSDVRTATFEVTGNQDGLKMYGGWRGDEQFAGIADVENQLDSRDLSANETTLSGDIGTTGDASDNAYHVVVFNGGSGIGSSPFANITADTELNGVTITGGHANDVSTPNNQGGGLFCDGSSSGNECNPTLSNIIFDQNAADAEGGALFSDGFYGMSSPTLTEVTFTGNSARSGAGMYSRGAFGVSSPVITGATFEGNVAITSGGAMYLMGDSGVSNAQITDAIFTGNEADLGAAGYINGANGEAAPQITNAVVTENATTNSIGAFYFLGDGGSIAAEVVNSIFADNGDVHVAFNDGNAGESPTLINSIFTGATGSAFNIQFYDSGQTPMQVVNSILWGNGAGDIVEASGAVSDPDQAVDVSYSIVDEAAYEEGSGDPNAGTGNLNTDPLFVDANAPAGPDGVFATEDDGLRLVAGSPAVDAGDNSAVPGSVTTDLIGDPRTQDGNEDGTDEVNLGAYETPGLPVATDVTITGTDGTGNDAGWRLLSVPYTGAVAGDLRMASSAGTNAPRFDRDVMAVWDDSDPDETTGGTGAYDIADASTQLGLGDGLLLYLEDDARDPVESGGLTISLDESTSATRHGTAPVVRNDLTRSARWHLLGNPYPTDYELSALTTGGSPIAGNGFKADAQVYDATDGTWQLLDTGTKTLAAWQGAFIERSDPDNGPTEVTFEPGGRTDASAPFIGSEMQGPTVASEGVQRGTLWLEGVVTGASGDPVATDQAIGVRFHESATDGWDTWDTSKLAPLEAPSLMLSAQGTGGSGTEASKAVESRPWPQNPDDPDADLTAVPIDVQGEELPDDGTLTLRVREWDLPDTWAAELIDTQGTSTESDDQTVPLEPGMDYQVDVSSLSANPETERFVVQIAPNTGALPVELAGFDAQRSGDDAITVQWETLSETNNAGFEVQRAAGSANESVETPQVETPQWDVSTGESWETIATLDGAGTTDEPQSYRFEDTDLPYEADSLRYRLRQVDTGGTESFSEAVTIGRPVTEAELLPTYPNPARSTATVRFAVPDQQPVRITLYDMLGRRVQTVVDTDAEGRTEQTLDVSRLASGTYFLRMATEAGPVDTQRVTVVR